MNKTVLYSIPVMFGLSLSAGASEEDMSKKLKHAKQETVQEFNEFKVSMNDKLDKLDAKIANLTEKAKAKGETAQETVADKVEDFKDRREDLGEKLSELSDDSKDSWKDAKLTVEHKYEVLENEVEKAFN